MTQKQNDISICLWNATSLNNKATEFGYFLHNQLIDITLVTETWLNPNTNVKYANYEIIRADSPRIVAGELLIAIKKTVQYCILPTSN